MATCLILAATMTAGTDSTAVARYCSLDITKAELRCHNTAEELSRALELAGVGTGKARPPVQTTAQVSVIGTIYDDVGYGGGYLNIVGNPCYYGYTDFIDLTWSGWNDRLSSFIGGSGCRLYLHDNSNGTGAGYGWASSSSWVGTMNDRTSSISFSP